MELKYQVHKMALNVIIYELKDILFVSSFYWIIYDRYHKIIHFIYICLY